MEDIRAELEKRILDNLLQENPGGTRESIKRVICDYIKELCNKGYTLPLPWGEPIHFDIDVDVENNMLIIYSKVKS